MDKCESVINDLDAFRDDELEQSRRSEIHQHLNSCSSCTEYHNKQESFEQSLRSEFENWQPPENLWPSINAAAQSDTEVNQFDKPGRSSLIPWATAALLIISVVVFTVFDKPPERVESNEVANALVNEFHTFVISHRDLDYSNSDPEKIREWFGSKIDFRTPLPVESSHMNLAGGRLCNMLDQRIVSYMYQVENAWISLYIMKAKDLEAQQSNRQEQVLKGYGFVEWEMDGLIFSLVGDIPVEQLRTLAEKLQNAHPVEALYIEKESLPQQKPVIFDLLLAKQQNLRFHNKIYRT